jgi:hypothetical protein
MHNKENAKYVKISIIGLLIISFLLGRQYLNNYQKAQQADLVFENNLKCAKFTGQETKERWAYATAD